jgi:hypothetical protein
MAIHSHLPHNPSHVIPTRQVESKSSHKGFVDLALEPEDKRTIQDTHLFLKLDPLRRLPNEQMTQGEQATLLQ